MSVIPLSELTTLRMVAGGEKTHDTVVVDGVRKHWVGIGWVDEGPATKEDYETLPVCRTIMPHIQALQAFALRNGRNRWRERLRLAWMDGGYRRWGADLDEAGKLQGLRNHASYGPGSGFIEKFNPKQEITWAKYLPGING